MNAISMGPLVLASDRAAAVAGLFVFTLVAGMIARRVDDRIAGWSFWALLGGITAGRAAHVVIHRDSFAEEPLRIFAFWQGGFYWPAGLAIALASIVIILDGKWARLASLVPIVAGLFVWHATYRLTSGMEAIPLPETTFRSLAGEELQLKSLTGRPIVLNLWASWCPPCRREMPMMADVATSTPGVSFVFANQDENRAQVATYLNREELDLPLMLLDGLGELARHYKAPGLPATLFIDSDGVLVDVHLGEISREILVEKISLLGGSLPGGSGKAK